MNNIEYNKYVSTGNTQPAIHTYQNDNRSVTLILDLFEHVQQWNYASLYTIKIP